MNIYAASVAILNGIFDIVVQNVGGFNTKDATSSNPQFTDIAFYRQPVDQFMYTVMYAVIVYILGTSSFKLIDVIPQNIMRWMGQNISTFSDFNEDAAQGLVGTATVGIQQGTQRLAGGLSAMAKSIPGVVKRITGG